MAYSKNFIAVPPGATIEEQLEYKNISIDEFATLINLSRLDVEKLIIGDIELTLEIAQTLEKIFGVPTEFWNKLESKYREKLIKVQEELSKEDSMAIMDNLGIAY